MEENTINEDDINEDIAENVIDNTVYLPTGQALSAVETYGITASEKSRFVVLLGGVGSGKTAICTSIYSHFLEYEFKNTYCFAGSKTLAAFEEYSFLTRMVSGRDTPSHDRTKKGEKNILHLRLQEEVDNGYINCLLADFSGEDYEDAVGNIEYAKNEFQLLKAANAAVIVIDGEKLCRAITRLPEIQRAINLLKTFYDAKIFSYEVPIIVVVSKFDLLVYANIVNWHQLILDNFVQQIPLIKNNFIINEVAPLSKHADEVAVGHGIKTLFNNIMQYKCEATCTLKLPDTNSEFEKWGRRFHA